MPRLLAAATIVLAGILAYANSVTGAFVFDDRPSIVSNASAHNPAPWAHPLAAMQAPRNITLSGRPVSAFTIAMNYALAPVDARNTFDPPAPGSLVSPLSYQNNLWGYHATNLAIHLLAALTLFGVVRRTLQTPALRATFGNASTSLAFVVALLWTLHPLQTGSVTYVIQRVESLMGLFMLFTLYCAIRAQESRAMPWSIAGVMACLLGMGSKEVMVGAPIIVMLWDWTFIPGPFAATMKRRGALYIGLALTWILLAMLVVMDPRPLSSGFHFAEWPWWRYLATQCGVLLHYLRLAFWPSPLVLDYDWLPARTIGVILLPALIINVLALVTLWQLAQRTAAGFAAAVFFVVLAPSSSVLPIITEIAAEHRMYVPLAAVVSLVVLGAYALMTRSKATAVVRQIAFAGALALAAFFAWQTSLRNDDYFSDERIWADTVQKRPFNSRARNNYASDLLKSGQAKAAAEHLQVAVTVEPNYAEAHANLGVALATLQQYPDATAHFERAIAIDPFYTSAFENMAEAYGAQNQLAKAVKYFIKALDQKPDDVALLNKAAWILATAIDPAARDASQALVLATHAVELTSRKDASSLDTLAAAYAEAGRFADAITTGTEALALANARGDRAFPLELEQRLSLYRSRKPFRQ